jgi:hypothetical protein
MRRDGDGRFCERCELHVADVASLDADGLDSLLANAGRVCARFELERGQPRTKLGIAAGFMVLALAGCTMHGPSSSDEFVVGPQDSGGVISGVVRGLDGAPLANAYVSLQSTEHRQPQELLTNASGSFEFNALASGSYIIQVHAGKARESKGVELPKDVRFQAYFSVDPDEFTVVGGAVSESLPE